MKISIKIYILLFGILISCQNKQNIDGNYSVCKYGGYLEIYFKKDSMRVAKNDDWIKLSKWRKIEIKKDTLYFETFGEWRDSTKAKILYLENNKIELQFLKSNKNLVLKPITEKIKIEKTKGFWDEFQKRSDSKKCK
jgi:hypothetical protein